MTSEGLGEMFEGDSLMWMGGRAEGLACTDPAARTPIGVSRNLSDFFVFLISSGDPGEIGVESGCKPKSIHIKLTNKMSHPRKVHNPNTTI